MKHIKKEQAEVFNPELNEVFLYEDIILKAEKQKPGLICANCFFRELYEKNGRQAGGNPPCLGSLSCETKDGSIIFKLENIIP